TKGRVGADCPGEPRFALTMGDLEFGSYDQLVNFVRERGLPLPEMPDRSPGIPGAGATLPSPIPPTPDVTIPNIPSPIPPTPDVMIPNIPPPLPSTPDATTPNIPSPLPSTPDATIPNIPSPIPPAPDAAIPNIPSPGPGTR